MKTRSRVPSLLATLAAALVVLPALAAQPDTRVRDEIPDEYKWDLAHIYEDWDAWRADLDQLQESMEGFAAYEGTLDQGADHLLEVLEAKDDLEMLIYRAYSYPGLMETQDMRDNEVSSRRQEVLILISEFETRTAWFTPELVAVGEETVMGWIDASEGLEPYRFPLEEVFRQQEHILDEDGERLLAYSSRFSGTPGTIYSMISTADVEFPTVTLSDGTEVVASHANYSKARSEFRVQADREAVFKAHFSVYDGNVNTYAAIYDGVLQRDWFKAQARGYESCAEAALDADAIPVSVLENLIATAKEGAEPLRRYHRLRKDRLGLEHYRYYDGYVPLVEEEWVFEYEDVQPLVIESVGLFGPEYQATVRRSFTERWIDVYENEGKRMGAFSWGVYGVHPYMLLNHADTLTDAFTVAHEMGHTMHSVLSHQSQPFATHDYSIFVAEVASMTSEDLFLDRLLEQEKDPERRIMLLQRAIDDIASGFYRQAMFADFEHRAHEAVEQGTPITAEVLQELYLDTLEDFFGDSLDDQQWYANTWARIPHFYGRPYYVYQYATSKSAASLMHERMTTGRRKARKEAVADFLELLSSGGDDSPIDQLADAGIDMTTDAPAQALVRKMEELVEQLEEELDRL